MVRASPSGASDAACLAQEHSGVSEDNTLGTKRPPTATLVSRNWGAKDGNYSMRKPSEHWYSHVTDQQMVGRNNPAREDDQFEE